MVGQPKTAKSRRTVALSPSAVSLLESIRTKQLESRLAAGLAWRDTGYVFTDDVGLPIAGDTYSKDFARRVRESGLPHLTFHGLRHAHATFMLTAGVHPKVVSERLGHATVSTTLDLYSHVVPGLQEDAALALDEKLNSASARARTS